jgi:hypothetical protein
MIKRYLADIEVSREGDDKLKVYSYIYSTLQNKYRINILNTLLGSEDGKKVKS